MHEWYLNIFPVGINEIDLYIQFHPRQEDLRKHSRKTLQQDLMKGYHAMALYGLWAENKLNHKNGTRTF